MFSLDIILFITFLGVNLVVGLLAGRQVKTLRDYSIGKKDFSTATITYTIVATWIGGSFLTFNLSRIYTDGLSFAIALISDSFTLLFTGLFLAVRMGEFLKNLSIAEAMGDLYGKSVRIITAICGILVTTGALAIQFKITAKVLIVLFNVEEFYSTIVAASIVVIYSAFGGIRAVTFTDVMQFFAFGTVIPLLTLVIWNGIKDHDAIIQVLKESPQFDYKTLIGSPPKLAYTLGLMLFYFIPAFVPAVFQRVSIANNVKQVKKTFINAFGLSLIITLLTILIGVLIVGQNPHLDPSKIFQHILSYASYPGFKGLILVGVMSMVMSTADSHINSAAVLLTNDIAKPLGMNFKQEIITARIFSFLLGGLALILALYKVDFLELVLLAWSFYMPIVTVPLLLAIFGFRSSTRAVLIGMAAGFLATLLWGQYLAHTGINNVIPGMLANLIFLMGSHYILQEPGGWVGIKDPAPLLAARQARKRAWQEFIERIKRPQIYLYLQESLPAKEAVYTFFGIYVMGATYALFFTLSQQTVDTYPILYNLVAHAVLIIMAVFITYPAWPPTFKTPWFITFAWPLGIGYLLFFVGTLLVLLSNFHQVQVMILMLNWVIASTLLSWPLLLMLASAGIALGAGVFQYYAGFIPTLDFGDSFQFKVTYGILLLSSFLIAIFRQKQDKKRLAAKAAYWLDENEDARTQIVDALRYKGELTRELNEEQIALLDRTAVAYMRQAIYRVTDYMRLEVSKIHLKQLLKNVTDVLSLRDLDPKPELLIKNKTKIENLTGDLGKLTQLIVDGILYVNQHNSKHQPITIIIEDTVLGHTIDHMQDYIRKLAALQFSITIEATPPATRPLYMVSPTQIASMDPQSPSEPKLLENLRIIDAHYGYAAVEHTQTQVYVVPVNVREVRGQVMELLREPAVAVPDELTHPLSMELEQKLFDRLKVTAVDLTVMQKALDTIKKYHGGTKRKSGEPFFTHPMQVALILMDYSKDQDTILGALLHDTVEDTALSLTHIQAMFGEEVAYLVSKSTNLEDKIRKVSLREHETNYRLINSEDTRAALVKLADRLHNMRTIEGHASLDKQQHIANETLLFFVPMAKQMGLDSLADELEQICLSVLEKNQSIL